MLHISRSLFQFAKRHRNFTVLALESSADDTGAAVVTSSGKILSNVVVKQPRLMEKYNGIQPFEALHEHQRNMPGAIQQALSHANLSIHEIDGIAFTRGPGMPGCLSVCANAAKALAAATNKPLVGVHHMQAHALTPLLHNPSITFPFLTLLISGGHTLLVLAHSLTSFQTLVRTTDESIGNSFDKVSVLLNIPLNGLDPGPALEQFCNSDTNGEPLPKIEPPLPITANTKFLFFSFSGLHSSVERYVTTRNGILDHPTKLSLAREFQRVAVAQLEDKVLAGLRYCRAQDIDIKHVVVSGGVASNQFIRSRLGECVNSFDDSISLEFPPPALCTDNAVMIAWASMHRFLTADHDGYDICSKPKWNIDELDV